AGVTALLQRTLPVEALRRRTRTLARGDRTDPLDLAEALEAEVYEPEAQVTQNGELSLRGGILDLYALTSPWPVRLEFFGDELESLRFFDPLTQVSREEIVSTTVPPAGELGILKRLQAAGEVPSTLLDYLPPSSILVLCAPEQLAERAAEYAQQTTKDDPFLIRWEEFQSQAIAQGKTMLELAAEPEIGNSLALQSASGSDSPHLAVDDPLPSPELPVVIGDA